MSSAHYPGAMVIRIDFWPAGELFPTQTILTDQVSYRSLYYTIQDQFAGSTGTAHTRGPFRRPRYHYYNIFKPRRAKVLNQGGQTNRL